MTGVRHFLLSLLCGCGQLADVPPILDGGATPETGTGAPWAGRLPPPYVYVYGEAPPVLTHHNDSERTGAQASETVLTRASLTSGRFGLAFSRVVQGAIYGQPLFVPKVRVGGWKERDVVFVATEHNDAYAFDAEDPGMTEPLWHVSFGPSIPSSDFDADPNTPYRDIVPELGVTSTPVIDPRGKVIYFFAQTKESGAYFNRLHALELETGRAWHSPLEITVSAPGDGAGSTNGVVTIPPKYILQRPALAFTGTAVWIAGGGHSDLGPYHGWVVVVPLDLYPDSSTAITTPSGRAGGISQSGGGPAGNGFTELQTMYVGTGNGTYGDSSQPPDLSESFLRVDAHVICPECMCAARGTAITDWFTPHDHEALDAAGLDLSGPMLLPETKVLVGGSKQGKLYVLDRTKLGHRTADDSQILQSFTATTGALYAGLVARDAPGGKLVYVAGQGDAIKAYRFVPSGSVGTFDTTPFAQSSWTVPTGTPGAGMSVTSNANLPGTGVLWMLTRSASNDGWGPSDATLRAFDADDLSELWSSETQPADAIGRYVKFTVPTVAGGRVFVPSVDVLRVFALRAL